MVTYKTKFAVTEMKLPVYTFYEEKRAAKLGVSRSLLQQQKARYIFNALAGGKNFLHDEFAASNGWLDWFMDRHGLSLGGMTRVKKRLQQIACLKL